MAMTMILVMILNLALAVELSPVIRPKLVISAADEPKLNLV
jgi:hypothetical protein